MADTYHKSSQLGASRRRFEDAQVLHEQKRWMGAIYLGGYAIECALKSLICHQERKSNFKDTQVFKSGLQGASLHSLTMLLKGSSSLQRAIELDRTNTYKNAWKRVSSTWRSNELRYSEKAGDKEESEQFIHAVKTLHQYLLAEQDEAS